MDDKLVGHELAELASNPLVNAWYAEEDPHSTDGDQGPVRGAVRDGGRGRVHRAGDEGQRGKDVQREGEEGQEVFGAVDLESCFEGLCGSECVGLGVPERRVPSSPLLSSAIVLTPM